MPKKSWKSLGSGEVGQAPPNSLGYVTCSQSTAQPPEECPVSRRPDGLASMRYWRSRSGISSAVNASPHGPLLTLLTNSLVPVGLDWSIPTQIIGGALPALISSHRATARSWRERNEPPKPWV